MASGTLKRPPAAIEDPKVWNRAMWRMPKLLGTRPRSIVAGEQNLDDCSAPLSRSGPRVSSPLIQRQAGSPGSPHFGLAGLGSSGAGCAICGLHDGDQAFALEGR